MSATDENKSRIPARLLCGAALFSAGLLTTRYWPDYGPQYVVPVVRALCDRSVTQPDANSGDRQPSELDQALATRDRLRQRLAAIQREHAEIAGRIRLLEAGSQLAAVQGRSDAEETQGQTQYQIQIRTQQLAELAAQRETTRRTLQRTEALVLELQRDATSERADRRALREAGELLWTRDPAGHGPNAKIPRWDWQTVDR